MATQPNPPRRPKLSLQINPTKIASPPRPPRGFVNSRDPTSFNTLSNVYLTAIERSSACGGTPLTAINTLQSFSIASPSEPHANAKDLSQRVVTPYVASYPETPLSATCSSPRQMEMMFPSVMTATPPLSAGPTEGGPGEVFTFDKGPHSHSAAKDSTRQGTSASTPIEARHARRRMVSFSPPPPPYKQPQSLHSILRNSPLPPRTAIPPPVSPRRQSQRIAERAARRVGYNTPLTQDIITKAYVRSHVDLLCEDGSPLSPAMPEAGSVLLENETRDGGQTPGPFEEMRRRVAGVGAKKGAAASPISSPGGIRKRRRVKRREFRWPLGREEEGEAMAAQGVKAAPKGRADSEELPTPMAIVPLPMIVCDEVPTPTIETLSQSADDNPDIPMSDAGLTSSRATSVDSLMPSDAEADARVPKPGKGSGKGDTPIPELAERATPMADDLS